MRGEASGFGKRQVRVRGMQAWDAIQYCKRVLSLRQNAKRRRSNVEKARAPLCIGGGEAGTRVPLLRGTSLFVPLASKRAHLILAPRSHDYPGSGRPPIPLPRVTRAQRGRSEYVRERVNGFYSQPTSKSVDSHYSVGSIGSGGDAILDKYPVQWDSTKAIR